MSENRFLLMGKRTLLLFSIAAVFVLCMAYYIGDIAQPHSSLFKLGRTGLSTLTLIQLFLVSFVTNFIRTIFTADKIVLRISLRIRIFCLGSLSLISITLMAAAFGWFPSNNLLLWVLTISLSACAFLISYRIVGKKRLQTQIYMDKLNEIRRSNTNDGN